MHVRREAAEATSPKTVDRFCCKPVTSQAPTELAIETKLYIVTSSDVDAFVFLVAETAATILADATVSEMT